MTDITELKSENQNLRFLNETIPCGIVKYTCEAVPRITYLNQRMRQILQLPEETGAQSLEYSNQNVFSVIPTEEQDRFSRYLERVLAQGVPLAGDMTLLRCDGTKVQVFGWVTVCVNEQGQTEFQSAVMDITQRYQEREKQEAGRYLKALSEVYDKIFEFNLEDHTVSGTDSHVGSGMETGPAHFYCGQSILGIHKMLFEHGMRIESKYST